MHVVWLELTDFRSYRSIRWEPDPGVNLLVGPNGAGKTNLLEAVAYSVTARSFRGVSDVGLIHDDADSAVVRTAIHRGSEELGETLVEMEIPRSGQRRALVDHNRLRRTSDLIEVMRVITFLPEDLDIIKRGPSYRRDVIDDAAVQVRPAVALDFSEYDKALRQRNALLRSPNPDDLSLSVWDDRLSRAGGIVMARRAAIVHEIAPHIEEAYRVISGEGARLAISYGSDWGGLLDPSLTAADQTAALSEAIGRQRRFDIERRVTSVGPHRDDPALLLDGADVRTHGSQGEQRTTALALRLGVHRAITERLGSAPTLLLDDVFSELDEGRARRLAEALPETQTLITSARPEDVPIAGQTWAIGDGEAQPQ